VRNLNHHGLNRCAEGQSPKARSLKGKARRHITRRAEPGGVGAQSALGLYYYFIDRGF